MTTTINQPISGRDAIQRRDALEYFIAGHFPGATQLWVSAALTGITGLAPSGRAGRPVWKGSELRSLLYMLLTLSRSVGEMNTPVPCMGVLNTGRRQVTLTR